MGRACIAALALALLPAAQAATCATFVCKDGFGVKDGAGATTNPSDGVCCEAEDEPAAGGTCGDPDPSKGTTVNFRCPKGWTAKANSDAAACTSVAECDTNCCVAPPTETATVTIVTTTTITPYDFSSGSSGDSLASDSSANLWSDTDSSGSGDSSGVFQVGSSGFSLPIWLWCVLLALCCCCCAALAKCAKKPAKKKKPTPKPAPKPAPVVEEEPLLPALTPLQPSFVPITTSAPVTTALAAPQMMQQPVMSYAPQAYATPTYAPQVVSAGYPAAAGTYGYGGYPGTVV